MKVLKYCFVVIIGMPRLYLELSTIIVHVPYSCTQLLQTIRLPRIFILTHQQQTVFENIVGKGEITCNKQFLLFPQFFLLNQIIVSPFVDIADFIFSFVAEMEEPKIGISGKGLTYCSLIITKYEVHSNSSFSFIHIVIFFYFFSS